MPLSKHFLNLSCFKQDLVSLFQAVVVLNLHFQAVKPITITKRMEYISMLSAVSQVLVQNAKYYCLISKVARSKGTKCTLLPKSTYIETSTASKLRIQFPDEEP